MVSISKSLPLFSLFSSPPRNIFVDRYKCARAGALATYPGGNPLLFPSVSLATSNTKVQLLLLSLDPLDRSARSRAGEILGEITELLAPMPIPPNVPAPPPRLRSPSPLQQSDPQI